MIKYVPFILSVVIAILGVFLTLKNSNIKTLESNILVKDFSIMKLTTAISSQNKAINKIKIDYNKKLKLYKSRIKIKYITKYITKDINVSRSNCKDINTIFDNIRDFGI
jgi:hypothetical protein